MPAQKQHNIARLGIIAGSGELPGQVIGSCLRKGIEIFVIAIEGETETATIQNAPHKWLHLGKVGEAVKTLKKQDIQNILMVGRVARPTFSALSLDFTAVRLLLKLSKLEAQGDDAVFSAIIRFLEEQGFTVLGIKDVLYDNLIPEGALGNITPDETALSDIAIGKRVAQTIGTLDIGQAVIVQRGQVLGVEGPEGTDRLIARCRDLHQEGLGGVLVKMMKPGQDTRVDLPAIGVYTVENAHANRLRGIAVEAGNALVIHRSRVIERADELGLFIVGI